MPANPAVMQNWENETGDFRVDLDRYVHYTILNILGSLSFAEKLSEGILKLRIYTDQLENLCYAKGYLVEDSEDSEKFKTDLKDFEKSIGEVSDDVFHAKVANYKFRLLLNRIQKTATIMPELDI